MIIFSFTPKLKWGVGFDAAADGAIVNVISCFFSGFLPR